MSHVTFHVSRVMCHVSHVTCHVSHVTCHMSHVKCHMSPVFFCFFWEIGGVSWWRVCYQRGLPRLFYFFIFYLIKWAMLKTIQYKNIWLRTYWRDKTKIIGGHWSLMRHTWPIQGLVHKSWQWIKTFGIYMSDWDKTFVNWEETNTTRIFFFGNWLGLHFTALVLILL